MEFEEADRHADPLDAATDLTIALVEAAREENQRAMRPEQEQDADGTWPVSECLECGYELGARATLGRVRCVLCQEEIDLKGKRR